MEGCSIIGWPVWYYVLLIIFTIVIMFIVLAGMYDKIIESCANAGGCVTAIN